MSVLFSNKTMERDPKFIKGVERLIDPIEVGSMHFLHGLNKLLPLSLQNFLSKKSSEKIPYMGFVVEPYSSFLFYKVTDAEKATSLLPEGFKLIKTHIFENDTPDYYAVIGSVRAHTSAFWGSRVEFYLIAENTSTGLLSWVILDYDSNTIGQDKKYGLRGPSATGSVITIDHRGSVYVDVNNKHRGRRIAYSFNTTEGQMRPLDQRLWLEGNLSVGYGRELNGTAEDIFSLKFEPCEMEKALDIKLDEVNIEQNTWYPGLFEINPAIVVCFPYAQHFISDAPGHKSDIRTREQLEEELESINVDQIKTFSVKSLRDLVLFQNVVTVALAIALLLSLIFR
ncbi:hypothetical protein KC640_00305 [Candidatus Dojkabacteria bacterium]|uniref:Uncharacterized protein n=1 Tax=Candidatus Dojkabacteria bacterium TaxID=2099670 RepID=A0A955I5E6_9BACT|nr:hypothetical protein [Candidatus Dojkabacteria bacterium]